MSRLAQLVLAVYVFLSVVFTSSQLLFSALASLKSRIVPFWPVSPSPASQTSGYSKDLTSLLETLPTSTIHWNLSSPTYNDGFLMQEDLFLSKLFANSLHPSKIVPFFYRATHSIEKEDITVTTLITRNRFSVFKRLVAQYQGPISIAIHVNNATTSELHDFLDLLHSLYTSSPLMGLYVDVHLILDSFDRQFNTWRNVARLFARTDFVMMLDIDFFLCTDFRTAIRSSDTIMSKLRTGMAALVIPAFEYATHSDGLDSTRFPRDKQTLLSSVKANRIRSFHSFWEIGHNSTDYPRFYSSKPGEVYKVTQYQSAYEPYVIFKKDSVPWNVAPFLIFNKFSPLLFRCDERFVGYGGNKAACLFEMYLSGVSFYVLSDHFIIHQNHRYEEGVRRNERKSNRKVYHDFKEETCLRYLKSFHESGLLNTSRGYNVQEECKKIKGLSRFAAHLIDPP